MIKDKREFVYKYLMYSCIILRLSSNQSKSLSYANADTLIRNIGSKQRQLSIAKLIDHQSHTPVAEVGVRQARVTQAHRLYLRLLKRPLLIVATVTRISTNSWALIDRHEHFAVRNNLF